MHQLNPQIKKDLLRVGGRLVNVDECYLHNLWHHLSLILTKIPPALPPEKMNAPL